jgi:glycosyltransferase involved in cell wall biosynthesis
MYNLETYKIKEDIEPWNIDIGQRIHTLTRNTVQKKIVYIYEAADTSTFRYRVYNMCQALSYSEHYRGTFFFENELAIISEYISYMDVVVFVRTRWSDTMDVFFSKVKKEKIPTLFDSDDLVFDLKSLPLLMNTLGVDLERKENYSYWFSYVSRLWLMGSMCDGYIGTNNFLSERGGNVLKKPVFVIQNFLNNEQIRVSKDLYDKKQHSKNNGIFTIGYFSGSPSHANDFKKIASELKELMDNYKDIQLIVVGFMEFPSYLKEYIQSGRIIYKTLVDFLTLQKLVASVDVNIVPLIVNEFTNCKSELKFFEAAIVGTLTCASPIYSYSESIHHQETGFLCNEGEWYESIENIYKQKTSGDILLNANQFCLNRYSPQNQVDVLTSIFDEVLS